MRPAHRWPFPAQGILSDPNGEQRAPPSSGASRGAQRSSRTGDSAVRCSCLVSCPSQPGPAHPVPWLLLSALTPVTLPSASPPRLPSSQCLSHGKQETAELGPRLTRNQVPAAPGRSQDLGVMTWGTETLVPTPGLWLRPQKAGAAAGRPTDCPPYARSPSLRGPGAWPA